MIIYIQINVINGGAGTVGKLVGSGTMSSTTHASIESEKATLRRTTASVAITRDGASDEWYGGRFVMRILASAGLLLAISVLWSLAGFGPVCFAEDPEGQLEHSIFLPIVGKGEGAGSIDEPPAPTPTPTATPVLGVADYYVDSTNGSDSNPGTSRDQAWKTIQKAANTMQSGKTVTVIAGNYSERVRVSRSGSSGAPITFQAERGVTLKGFTVYASYISILGFDITDTADAWVDGWGIYIKGSNCVVSDNYIHYATHGGILLDHDAYNQAQTSNCTITNNRLYRNSQVGIEVRGKNHLVENNEIWGTIQYHPSWANPPSWLDADGMRFFGSGHVFRKNYIHDITFADPENVNPHIDCFQTWDEPALGSAKDSLIEQNVCWLNVELGAPNAATKFIQLGANASGLTIRNNVSRAYLGILLEDNATNNRVVNNVLVSDPSKQSGGYIQAFGLTSSPNNTFKNNIIYNFANPYINADSQSRSGLDAGYNIVYRSDGQTLAGSPYPNDLWGVDPKFVNAGGQDFRLLEGSPAIDTGIQLAYVPNDFDNVPRPQHAAYDIGAHEQATLLAANLP